MTFSVVVHHKGSLVKVPKLHYSGSETHVLHDLDVDTWSYFEALGYVKDLGHKENVKLWWKSKYGSFEKGLKELKNDVDAVEMENYVVGNKYEVQLYVEHLEIGSTVQVDSGTNNVVMNMVENEGGTTAEPGGESSRVDMPRVAAEAIDMVEDGYSSDDSAKDVHFDDSEEERVLGDDDGFELTDIGEAEAALNQQVEGIKMKSVVEEQ
ncbi:hypothetical protein SESBI_19239, partial [Sesbania bispinosa]